MSKNTSPSRASIQKKMLDAETYINTQKFGQVVSDFFYASCNEPTVGLWYVQENIRNVVPRIVDTKRKFKSEAGIAESCTYGTDFSLTVVKSLRSLTGFSELLERVRASTAVCDSILRERADARLSQRQSTRGQAGTVISPPPSQGAAPVQPEPVQQSPPEPQAEQKVSEEQKPAEPVEEQKPPEEQKKTETASTQPAATTTTTTTAPPSEPKTETTEPASEATTPSTEGQDQLEKVETAVSDLGFTPMTF